MRYVKKDLKKLPRILTDAKTVKNLKEIIESSNAELIKTNLYQDTYTKNGKKHSRVRDELNLYYYSKCAYCERLCKAEIEHYRPKTKCTSGNGTPEEPGYHWLCYEWSNLLPSCHECNTSGGKGIQFPILGKRLTPISLSADGSIPEQGFSAVEKPFLAEQAYLLHPEIDDPSKFLGAKIDDKLKGINLIGTDGKNMRGERTINICNLNRSDLQIARLKLVKGFAKSIIGVFEMLKNGIIQNENLQQVLNIQFSQFKEDANDIEAEYTFVSSFILSDVDNFRTIVLPLLVAEIRPIVLKAFTNYKH
ncbi:hypothetical protein [Dyadobacter sp. 22481]|uniref:hypothetical protein n=1 Tax=Dyadobacter sp. 22481 TaxID=3453926 RepID=UPI003F85E500